MTAPEAATPERLPGWEDALQAVLTRWQASTYAMHSSSCLHFAREIIISLIGGEPLDALGVRLADVTTPLGAARLLHRYGDAAAIITAVLGDPLPPLLARRGDLAAVLEPDAEAGRGDWSIGVVDGVLIHLTAHDHGLTVRPLQEARHVWRVGA